MAFSSSVDRFGVESNFGSCGGRERKLTGIALLGETLHSLVAHLVPLNLGENALGVRVREGARDVILRFVSPSGRALDLLFLDRKVLDRH